MTSFDVFFQNYFKIEAAKYPFLSGPQIKQRVRNMWKKQQSSESKLIDKNSKIKSSKMTRRKISDKENIKGKKSSETTGTKQKSPKSLVPLKVDFVPSKGALKRKSNSENKKRHVSFNKELYIRYRTTSEESSNSTIKDKKKIRLRNSQILKENTFSKNKFYSLNNGLLKQRNSERDKKFDELLNINCSWSYKSQKDKLNSTETNKKRIQIMDTELDDELYNSKNKPESNDKSYCKKSENLSNDTPDKINARHKNMCQKDGQIELNSFQMKTYSKTDNIEETKPQNKCEKPRLSQSNKITSMNLTHHSILSSSSSEDDVFQTRYSIFDKHDHEATDNINDLNLKENNSDGEYNSGNISNMKTTPIIIEARAYEEKKYPGIDEKISQTKEQRETSLLPEIKSKTELRDFLIEEENNLNTNINSNYIQISDDNLNADFNFTDNISRGKSNKKCTKEMMVDVTVTPKQYLVSKNIEKPKVIDEDIIIEDIFNGTFDITAYKTISSKTTEFPKQYENNKLKSVMQTIGGKGNHKRKINELVTANKRVKHETILESKNKKNLWKTSEEAKELNKKSSKKELNEDKNFNSYQLSNAFSNKKQPQQKKTKEKFDSFNININFLGLRNSPHENRQMKLKNSQMKYEDKNTYDTEGDSVRNKYSRRKVRSSSRIASKKIKEIEKIENLLDLDEEIIVTDEETKTNIYDNLHNNHKECNYMEKFYSLRGNSNTFKPKTSSTNRKKEKRENKNSEMSMQHEDEFTTIKERDNIVQHSDINKNKSKPTKDEQISRPIIHLLKTPHSSEIVLKQSTCKDNKKDQASSVNSFYSYIANADHNLPKGNQTFEKRSKTDTNSKNSELTHHSSRFFMGENSQTEDTNNFTVSEGHTKENKPRTWEMLENELMKDLDNEQLSDNVYKTVILKKQETVVKKEVEKDVNLYTVSNTSMLHTISKSKTGNNYNLKYEIKNTKSKFVGPKADPKYNFKNTTIAQQRTSKDSNFKSNSIVTKTIAAMEKCAAKFTTPEVKLYKADHMVSNWQLENLSIDQDTHQETQFHSHMTFMAHEDKKCYSNKVVGCRKKSNQVKKSCDFDQKDNSSKAISNLSGTQRNKGLQRALSTEYSYKPNKNNLPIEYPQSHTNNDMTQALVPYGTERNNPWQNLMEKLHLQEEYQGLKEETSISNCAMKDQNTESLVITKTYTQSSNNLERNETLLIQTDYEVNKTKFGEETLSDQHIPADVESDTQQSEIHTPKTKKIMENLTSRSVCDQSNTENIKEAQKNNEICRKLELQEINNKDKITENHLLNTVSKEDVMKSPSFKFKLNKQGTLKLKKYSSGSSSSKSSENSLKLKKTKLTETKVHECNTSATSTTKDKYKNYLKKLFENQNSVTDENNKIKFIEDNAESNKNTTLKEPSDKSPKSLRKTKDSLIARQEDDIFSLSSSSDESSDTSKKNYGTGPMCELFDEE